MSLHLIPQPSPPAPQPSLDQALLPVRGADIPLLASLDVLLEERNVTRAAARLHLSQPALSAQLSRLRSLFNDPLLMPAEHGRGLVPSPFAVRLHARLRPALSALSAAIRLDPEDFPPQSAQRCFNLAANTTASTIVLPGLAVRLGAQGNPQLKLTTVEPDYTRLVGQLEKAELDLCLAPACMLPPGLSITELTTTPLVLAQRRNHPRGLAPPTLKEYCALDHLNVARGGTLHGFIDEQLYRLGQARQVSMGLHDFGSVPAVLLASDLVCTLPAAMAHQMGAELDLVALPFLCSTFMLCMAWHPRSDDDPGLRWLREEIQTVMQPKAQQV